MMYRQTQDSGPTFREINETVVGIESGYKTAFNGLLSAQYELSVAALDDLGFGEEDGVPPFETVRDAVSPSTMKWLTDRSFQLIIAPSVQEIGLQGSRYEPGLVPRFDKKQSIFSRTKVSKSWQSIGDKSPYHDNGSSESFSAALILHNHPKMPDPSTTVNGQETLDQTYQYNAPVNKKIAAFEEERAREARHGRQLASISISQILALEAQGRQLGQETFHQLLGSTLLSHYPKVQNGNLECFPTFMRIGLHGRKAILAERWDEIASEPLRRVLELSVSQPES